MIDEAEVEQFRKILREELDPMRAALRNCANGIGECLSGMEKLVLAIGVRDKDGPSIAMQLRDMDERLRGLQASVIRVEVVAGGAREASDRTHRLLLTESDKLGAKDQSMLKQIDELNERFKEIVQKDLQRAGGEKP
jgi:hypothetical protein